jgi:hypothetical protein
MESAMSQKTIRVTVKQLKEIRGLKNQVEANSIMNLLKDTGNAKPVGKLKNGPGKPPVIYEVPLKVTIQLFEDTQVVESEAESLAIQADVLEATI